MTTAYPQVALYLGLLALAVRPLGGYMARVYAGEPTWLDRACRPLERLAYRAAGVDPAAEMGWQAYAAAVLAFNGLGLAAAYVILRAQAGLPLNPAGRSSWGAPRCASPRSSTGCSTSWCGTRARW